MKNQLITWHPNTPSLDFEVGLAPFDTRVIDWHGVDTHLLWVGDKGRVSGHCSLWWSQVPSIPGEKLGVVGHYAALSDAVAQELLSAAQERLAAEGCTLVVGPMDGNTWRRYRLVVESDGRAPFFLEPGNPANWPSHFIDHGWEVMASYSSSVMKTVAPPPTVGEKMERLAQRVENSGIAVREIDLENFERDLKQIYEVSLRSFQDNFLYTPLAQSEFLALYQPVMHLIDPRNVLLAERGAEALGFVFALPNFAPDKSGAKPERLIVKTLAVAPEAQSSGLGGLLLHRVHTAARELGYREIIHALQYQSNRSLQLSARYGAEVFRRYHLYQKRLQTAL